MKSFLVVELLACQLYKMNNPREHLTLALGTTHPTPTRMAAVQDRVTRPWVWGPPSSEILPEATPNKVAHLAVEAISLHQRELQVDSQNNYPSSKTTTQMMTSTLETKSQLCGHIS